MSALTGYERRHVQAGATTSHLSLAAAPARKGNPLSLTLELADGTRLELELSRVVSWGVTRPDVEPAEPVLICTDASGRKKRARLARMLPPT